MPTTAVTEKPVVSTPTVAPPSLGASKAPEAVKPPMYAVILHNDNTTDPRFVVEVLSAVFGLDRQEAQRVMMLAHTRGSSLVRVYSKEVAETKMAIAMARSLRGVNLLNPTAPCELTFSIQPE